MTNAIIATAIAALIRIESGGDSSAVGDGGRAVGCLQMWPCAVAEANRLAGRRLWTLADRRNPQLSRAMAHVILAHHYRRGNRDAVSLALRWRNPYSAAPSWYAAKVQSSMGSTE
jgi:hypothetical protein